MEETDISEFNAAEPTVIYGEGYPERKDAQRSSSRNLPIRSFESFTNTNLNMLRAKLHDYQLRKAMSG